MGDNVPNLGIANVETPARPTSLTVPYNIGTLGSIALLIRSQTLSAIEPADLVLVESEMVVRYILGLFQSRDLKDHINKPKC